VYSEQQIMVRKGLRRTSQSSEAADSHLPPMPESAVSTYEGFGLVCVIAELGWAHASLMRLIRPSPTSPSPHPTSLRVSHLETSPGGPLYIGILRVHRSVSALGLSADCFN
jgi:hypothetical protein